MRLGILLFLAGLTLLPSGAGAVELPEIPDIVPCPLTNTILRIPCSTEFGSGAAGASTYLIQNIFPAARIVFIATAILMFTQYALKLLFDPESSETISSTKLAYGYGIVACAIVGVATFIVEAVGQSARATIVNDAPINTAVGNIILYMRLIVATLVTLFLLIQGIRLIMKQGSEEEFQNAKTQFIHTIMGIALILLANILVSAFLPGSGSVILAAEIVGIINFTLTILGALAVIAIIIAGIMLIFSIDEGLRDRAKKAIFVAVVGLIVAILSYVIVRFFINVGYAAA
jgi:hypothetical protein